MADETPIPPDPIVESLAATIRSAIIGESLNMPGSLGACQANGCSAPGAAAFCGCRRIAAVMAARIAPLSPPNGGGEGDRERIIQAAVYLAGHGYKPIPAVEAALQIVGKVDHPTAGRPR